MKRRAPSVLIALLMALGSGPAGASSDARKIVWVALEGGDRIAKVDIARGTVLRRFEVPGAPHNIAANASGTVVAALWHQGRISIIRDGRVRSIYLGGSPHDVKLAEGRVVVANQTEARLDLVSLTGSRRRMVALKADPHDVAITPNGETAWATLEGSDDLAVVDLDGGRVKRYVSTGRSPHDILFAPDGKLWVTDWNGAVHVFSRTGRHLQSRPLGVEAHHLAFTPDGKRVWITDHGAHKIFVLATRDARIVERIDIAGAPHHVTITPDGAKAIVADNERGLLVVYRTDTMRRVARIEVGVAPHGVWAQPRGSRR